MCEIQTNCGFYQYLVQEGMLKNGNNCPKPTPANCPRYKSYYGTDEGNAARIFKVSNAYTEDKPMSTEEIIIWKEGEK